MSLEELPQIDDVDICRLLSNMFDNAIESTKKAVHSEKNIYFEISYDKGMLIFLLKNSIDRSVLKGNPNLKTTHKNKVIHGNGISIIREIANKYNGLADFYEKDNFFFCCVRLYV